MNLRREYLRFFNSGSAWTVYAARNQSFPVYSRKPSRKKLSEPEVGEVQPYHKLQPGNPLSIASPVEETHYNSPRQEEGVQPRGDGQSPYTKYFNPNFARDYLKRKYHE